MVKPDAAARYSQRLDTASAFCSKPTDQGGYGDFSGNSTKLGYCIEYVKQCALQERDGKSEYAIQAQKGDPETSGNFQDCMSIASYFVSQSDTYGPPVAMKTEPAAAEKKPEEKKPAEKKPAERKPAGKPVATGRKMSYEDQCKAQQKPGFTEYKLYTEKDGVEEADTFKGCLEVGAYLMTNKQLPGIFPAPVVEEIKPAEKKPEEKRPEVKKPAEKKPAEKKPAEKKPVVAPKDYYKQQCRDQKKPGLKAYVLKTPKGQPWFSSSYKQCLKAGVYLMANKDTYGDPAKIAKPAEKTEPAAGEKKPEEKKPAEKKPAEKKPTEEAVTTGRKMSYEDQCKAQQKPGFTEYKLYTEKDGVEEADSFEGCLEVGAYLMTNKQLPGLFPVPAGAETKPAGGEKKPEEKKPAGVEVKPAGGEKKPEEKKPAEKKPPAKKDITPDDIEAAFFGEEPAEKADPAVKEPEVKDPEVKEPEVKDPEVKEPEVKQPEAKVVDLSYAPLTIWRGGFETALKGIMKEIRSVRALRKGSSKSGDPLVRRYPKLVMQYVKGKRPMIKAHFAALKEAFKKSIGIENYKEKDLNEYVAYHLTVIARDYYFSKKGDMPTKEILENLPKLFDKEFQPIIAKLRAELSKAKSFMEMWKPEVEGCKYEDFIKANTSKKTYASKSHRRLQALLKIGETEPAKVEAFKEQYCPAPKEDAALGAKGDDPATTGPELPNLKTGEGSGLAGLLKPGEIKVTMGRKEPRVVVDLSGGEEAGMDDGVGVEVVQARELNMKGCTDFVPHTNSGNDPVPMEHYDTCEFELSDGRSFKGSPQQCSALKVFYDAEQKIARQYAPKICKQMKAAFKKSTSGEVCGTIGYISDDGTPINFTVKGKGCRHGQKALALIAERDMKIFQSRVKKAAQIMSYLVK